MSSSIGCSLLLVLWIIDLALLSNLTKIRENEVFGGLRLFGETSLAGASEEERLFQQSSALQVIQNDAVVIQVTDAKLCALGGINFREVLKHPRLRVKVRDKEKMTDRTDLPHEPQDSSDKIRCS